MNNSNVKKYALTGLLSIMLVGLLAVPLANNSFKRKEADRSALENNMQRNKSELIGHVKETYSSFMEPNDLSSLINHIDKNYKTE